MVPWKDLALRMQYDQMKEHKFEYRSVIWPLVAHILGLYEYVVLYE